MMLNKIKYICTGNVEDIRTAVLRMSVKPYILLNWIRSWILRIAVHLKYWWQSRKTWLNAGGLRRFLRRPHVEAGCPWTHAQRYVKTQGLFAYSWLNMQSIVFHKHQNKSFSITPPYFPASSLPSPQLNFSHRRQCLVTTVDYTESPADLMGLNDWACPASADANVFPRWQNGESVIFNACCWVGTAQRQQSLWLVIQSNKSWHRWSEPSTFKF